MHLLPPTLDDYESVQDEKEALQIEDRVRLALADQLPLRTINEEDDEEENDNGNVKQVRFRYILALDIGYSTSSELNVAVGILYDQTSQKTIANKVISQSVNHFKYIPGLLAFRELPLLAKVIKELLDSHCASLDKGEILLLCDGNGTLHPRLCGIACHLGILFGLPSIGVGKTYLIGIEKQHVGEDHSDFNRLKTLVGAERGSKLPLYVRNRLAGYMLRTQTNVKPIFVSSGFDMKQKDACQIVLDLCSKYRQPEPIRLADHLGRMEIQRLESDK